MIYIRSKSWMTCRSTCFNFWKETCFLCTFLITRTLNQRWIFCSCSTKMYIIMFLSITSVNRYALWRRNSSKTICDFARTVLLFPTLKSIIEFTMMHVNVRWFAAFTIYFEFESFLMPVSSCLEASSTEVIEQHIPSGFALTLIENGFSTRKEFVIDCSDNCMTNLSKNYMRWRENYTMQRDNSQYIWDNKCQNEVVQLSVGFVKNLLDPKIQKFWTIATTTGISLVLHMKSATG